MHTKGLLGTYDMLGKYNRDYIIDQYNNDKLHEYDYKLYRTYHTYINVSQMVKHDYYYILYNQFNNIPEGHETYIVANVKIKDGFNLYLLNRKRLSDRIFNHYKNKSVLILYR